jgi:hypothetical protein
VNNRRSILRLFLGGGIVAGTKIAYASEELKFSDLYVTGVELTPRALSLGGKEVVMSGFMAPPLKAEVSFFVLTKVPMAVCPFCDSQMDWPDDIVLVRTNEFITFTPFNRRIEVKGILELGFTKDADTGFVSFVRLAGANYALS